MHNVVSIIIIISISILISIIIISVIKLIIIMAARWLKAAKRRGGTTRRGVLGSTSSALVLAADSRRDLLKLGHSGLRRLRVTLPLLIRFWDVGKC